LRHSCQLGVPGGVENKNGKVNILMQSQLSRVKIDSFSLVSDTMFVMQVRAAVPNIPFPLGNHAIMSLISTQISLIITHTVHCDGKWMSDLLLLLVIPVLIS
jgi:hypothetical protein